MKKTLVIGAIAAVTTAGFSATPVQAMAPQPSSISQAAATTTADPHFSPADRVAALQSARDAAKATVSALGLSTGTQLKVSDALVDTDGATHTRYERTYEGLRVIGGDMIVHSGETGAITGVDKASEADIVLASTTPATVAPTKGGTLVVFASNHKPVLAWESRHKSVAADGDPMDMLTYTNASTGKVLASWNQIDTADGTGSSLYSGEVTLSTSGSFDLTDETRGSSSIYDANNTESDAKGDLFTDDDNAWGDGTDADRQSAAVDAAYGAANTWDFYKNAFGRDGIKDDGVAAYSRVHYGDNYENAFWDDACFCMTYGDGGSTFGSLVSLDVAGHEMTHGVTSATAGLEYTGESGGINEATSDIFGTMVEFTAANTEDAGDYYIGEEIAKDGTFLRRMDDPTLDGGSAGCWTADVGDEDVHNSSGVGNHLFYLLAEGSGAKTIGGLEHDSPTCDDSTVTGIGNEEAAQIWYRALTTYMTSTTDYTDARDSTIKAAVDLYGADSTECSTTVAAWDAVAVPAGAEVC